MGVVVVVVVVEETWRRVWEVRIARANARDLEAGSIGTGGSVRSVKCQFVILKATWRCFVSFTPSLVESMEGQT